MREKYVPLWIKAQRQFQQIWVSVRSRIYKLASSNSVWIFDFIKIRISVKLHHSCRWISRGGRNSTAAIIFVILRGKQHCDTCIPLSFCSKACKLSYITPILLSQETDTDERYIHSILYQSRCSLKEFRTVTLLWNFPQKKNKYLLLTMLHDNWMSLPGLTCTGHKRKVTDPWLQYHDAMLRKTIIKKDLYVLTAKRPLDLANN